LQQTSAEKKAQKAKAHGFFCRERSKQKHRSIREREGHERERERERDAVERGRERGGGGGGGGGEDVNLSQGDTSCGPTKRFWANHGVVMGQHLVLSHISHGLHMGLTDGVIQPTNGMKMVFY